MTLLPLFANTQSGTGGVLSESAIGGRVEGLRLDPVNLIRVMPASAKKARRTRHVVVAGREDPMIRVQLNGQPKALNDYSPNPLTVEKLVSLLKLNSTHIAVAVNFQVIPRSQFPQKTIRDGDAIDILQPTAGG